MCCVLKEIFYGQFGRISGVGVNDEKLSLRRKEFDAIGDQCRHLLVELPDFAGRRMAEGRRVQRDLFGDLRPEERADFLRKAQRMSVEVMRRASGEFGVSGVFVRNAEGGLAAAAKRLALVLGEGL